ncbi:xanthine dehydrogenase family protein subunit M [Brevibacillus laterosporus]|uniref:FAD binding domain-containing protein n=1 Tax=Brevibacillus laterosporus TaxID=1465 RepID=UPI0035A61592
MDLGSKRRRFILIPYDFDYVKPDTIQEAIAIFHQWDSEGKQPKYFCGGTEIITMARLSQLHTKGIIDLKDIPECRILDWKKDQLVIGSAVTLAQLEAVQFFPLLSRVCNRIADHTSRCKITLGGNICGKIIYRETVLPLLVANAEFHIATESGVKQVSIHDVFEKELRLLPHEILLQITVDKQITTMPYRSEKRTKIDRIGYPIVSLAAIHNQGEIQVAFSGICTFPFRSKEVERALNDQTLSLEDRVRSAIHKFPEAIMADHHASASFREFIVHNLILDTIESFERA